MSLTIPVPINNIEILFLLLGMSFGRSFGKKLDQNIQETTTFKNRSGLCQWIIKAVLDFTHHWWIGCIIWLYAPSFASLIGYPGLVAETMFFGVGLFLDDIRDFKHVLERYKTSVETDIQ